MKVNANMVTLARIALLPVPCLFLLYGNRGGWWIAFAMFSVLAATDFIDGMMARAEGPTKLGGLIDPVADKIFVAAVVLSFYGVHLVGVWFPILILSREFVLTSLRASVAFRGEEIQTSNFAKIKTIYQMGGFGTIFLTMALPKSWLIALSLFIAIVFLCLWIAMMIRSKAPYWVLPVSIAFFLLLTLRLLFSVENAMLAQAIVIVCITWASGLDYLFSSLKVFRRSGLKKYDIARLFWAICQSVVLPLLVGLYEVVLIPVLITISFELALGGVDAVVASEKSYAGSKPFVATGLTTLLVSALVFANWFGLLSLNLFLVTIFGSFVSALVFGLTFTKWRALFQRAF